MWSWYGPVAHCTVGYCIGEGIVDVGCHLSSDMFWVRDTSVIVEKPRRR